MAKSPKPNIGSSHAHENNKMNEWDPDAIQEFLEVLARLLARQHANTGIKEPPTEPIAIQSETRPRARRRTK